MINGTNRGMTREGYFSLGGQEDLSQEDDMTWDPNGEKSHVEFFETE